MSGITSSRQALAAALQAAGLRVTFDPGMVAPPAVLVAATDPWVSPSGLTVVSRQLRWRVACVAGQKDTPRALEDLEDLVAAALVAIHSLDGWGTPTFDAPGTVDLAGVTYLSSTGRVDHLTEV